MVLNNNELKNIDITVGSNEKSKIDDALLQDLIIDKEKPTTNNTYKNIKQSWFVPFTFRKKYGQQYKVWFPKLAVENRAVTRDWHNELSQDGSRIIEFNESSQWTAEDLRTDIHESRVTFTHVLDPVTHKREYRFVGVFKYAGIEDNKNIYTRTADSFPLIKP